MLKINSEIQSIQKVDSSEHNVARVNSIKTKYPDRRQESKAPTFCPDLSGDISNPDGKLRIYFAVG